MTRTQRVALGLVGLVVGLNVAVKVVESVFPAPGGPSASAYGTREDGAAAYAELLRRAGHEVERVRERPRDVDLDPAATTVVLLDPGIVEDADVDALRTFVERGGRLLASGPGFGWLGRLLQPAPDWQAAPAAEIGTLAPLPELAEVHEFAGSGVGSWADAGASLPLLGNEEASVLSVATIGGGRAFLLADTGPLTNAGLDLADNAALGLALAGESSRRVAFLERYHGYGAASGFDAIPNSWLVTLGGMLAAALAFMVARGRRLGPAEETARQLAPARALYVESLGAILARTRRPAEASAPLRARALAAASRLGVSADSFEQEPRNAEELLRLGRAAAELERRGRGAGT